MKATTFLSVLVLLVAAVAAGGQEMTLAIDSMGGPYAAGPIGPLDDDWEFFGYGPPSYNYVETGVHVDGDPSQGWRFPAGLAPGTFDASQRATVAYLRRDFDPHAVLASLGAPPMDPDSPVAFTAWFYGFHGLVDPEDPVFSPDIECFIIASTDPGNRINTPVNLPPLGGETWQAATSVLLNGVQPGTTFLLAVGFNFDPYYYDPERQTTVLVDNVTITYTPAAVQTLRILSIQRVDAGRLLVRWEPSLGRTYQVFRQTHAAPGYQRAGPFEPIGPVLSDQEFIEDADPPTVGAYYRVRIID